MIAAILRYANSWLRCRRNPLLADAEYASAVAEERELTRRHKNAAKARQRKQDRLHQMLAVRP